MLCSWVQYVGARARHVEDIGTATLVTHIDVQQNEVVFLPYETCKWLLQNESVNWVAQTVAPLGLSIAHDNTFGLDFMDAPTPNPWGISSTSGLPYFEVTGRLGDNEHARLIYSGGLSSLVQS